MADAALEVRELGLKPGQKLLVSVKAADLCDLGHGPNVASSERWLLDVVTPEQLRAMLEARELVLRQRFERMIQEMTETRDLLARLRVRRRTVRRRRPKPKRRQPAEGRQRIAGRQPSRATKSRPIRPPGSATLRLLRVKGR